MKNNESSRLTDKIIEALRKSALEIEKFQVEVALGKAEAKKSFEEIKKNLNQFIHDSKFQIKAGKEKVNEIQVKLDKLIVQLNLGKAETIEAFNHQKKELLNAIHELEVKIKSNETLKKAYAFVLIQLETFKVQLEILEKKLDETFADREFSLKKSKEKFLNYVEDIKKKYSKKKETKWEHFQNEISEAFSHLKQAFS